MCGIAGYLHFEGAKHPPADLERMCDKLLHRGPDGYGYYHDESVSLGHRRLSIIDVSGGAQPFGNEDRSIQVVFNGEIYNYKELRASLLNKGHRFTTSSDTEVLVHLYEDVGERLPEYLRGMFAFAIWDRRNRQLLLARDRFGEKPLYFSTAIPGFRMAFASEVKALTVLPGFPSRIDHTAVADYLALGYVPDPKSIYAGVSKLLPGHSLLVTNRGAQLRQYWKPEFSESGEGDFRRATEEVAALAVDAVRSQMVSDVPFGAFLSGGVDSSAVVALMAQNSSRKVNSFSIGFSNKAFDELSFARTVAGRYATNHQEQTITPEIHDVLPTLVKHYDEPFADSSAVPLLYLAKMTRQHVTVALSGDGADEIFGGYRRYYFGVLEERIRARFPQWFRRGVFGFGGQYYPKFDYLPQVFRAKTLLSNLAMEIGDAYFTSMSIFRDEGLTEILSPELQRSLSGYSPRNEFRQRFDQVKHLSPLQQMQAVDFQTYLPGDILVKTDRATMAHSLESRAPFLDHRIAETGGCLTDSFKLQGTNGKRVLKAAMESHVSSQILTRTKMGFSVPLAEWFRTSLRGVFEDSMNNSATEAYFCRESIARIWQEHQSRRHDHSRKLWTLMMFALWNCGLDLDSRNSAGEHLTVGLARH